MRTPEPSLFSRLVTRVGLVLLVGASTLITAAWYYGQTASNKTYDQLLRGAALQIADGITQTDGKLIVNLPPSAFELLGFAERDRIFYRIVGPDGAVVSGYPDLNINDDLIAARRDRNLKLRHIAGRKSALLRSLGLLPIKHKVDGFMSFWPKLPRRAGRLPEKLPKVQYSLLVS